jgi:hypothetical protein
MKQPLWTNSARDRRYFIGGSDARIVMGSDEAALLRLWREKPLVRTQYRAGSHAGPKPGPASRSALDGRHRGRHGRGYRSSF